MTYHWQCPVCRHATHITTPIIIRATRIECICRRLLDITLVSGKCVVVEVADDELADESEQLPLPLTIRHNDHTFASDLSLVRMKKQLLGVKKIEAKTIRVNDGIVLGLDNTIGIVRHISDRYSVTIEVQVAEDVFQSFTYSPNTTVQII